MFDKKIQTLSRMFFLFVLVTTTSCNQADLKAGATMTPEKEIGVPMVEITPTVAIPTALPELPILSPTTAPDQGDMQIISPENAARLVQVKVLNFENPARVAWSSNGNEAAFMAGPGLIVINSLTYETLSKVEVESPIYLLDFSPISGKMATTMDDLNIEIRDIRSGAVFATVVLDYPLSIAYFSPDGNTLAVSEMDEIAVSLFDANSGLFIKKISGFETAAPAYSGVVADDNRHILWHARATVQISDIESGEFGPALFHEDFVSSYTLNPAGTMLATAAYGTLNGYSLPLIKFWDSFTGQEKNVMPAGESNPQAMTFSPDGRLLAANDRNLLTLWDVTAGQLIGAFSGHEQEITSIAFSPDGKRLATTSFDGTLRFWQISP